MTETIKDGLRVRILTDGDKYFARLIDCPHCHSAIKLFDPPRDLAKICPHCFNTVSELSPSVAERWHIVMGHDFPEFRR